MLISSIWCVSCKSTRVLIADGQRCRFRRAPQAQDLTIRKPSRVPYWIGSRREGSLSIPRSCATSRLIADFITNGLGLYCVLLGWIGQILSKFTRSLPVLTSQKLPRIKEKLRTGDLLVTGDQWSIFLYQGEQYDADDPWNGLFRSSILVCVSFSIQCPDTDNKRYQAYKYIFTSPSSVDKEPKATRSGNARIHGMTRVTPASIAYIATQVSRSIHNSSNKTPPIIS